MKYIGKYGEYAVLSSLLKRNVECYLAIKTNQEDYDITVIANSGSIVRVQVKSTELDNESTNNPIGGTKKKYNFLVIVVVSDRDYFYILNKREVEEIRKNNKALYTTQRIDGKFRVKPEFEQFLEKWEKIEGA